MKLWILGNESNDAFGTRMVEYVFYRYVEPEEDKFPIAEGIREIHVSISPKYKYVTVFVSTHHRDVFLNIVKAGKGYYNEDKSPNALPKDKLYYFDSRHHSLNVKSEYLSSSDELRQDPVEYISELPSDRFLYYIESGLYHTDSFVDKADCEKILLESLNLLSRVDNSVSEITEYLQGSVAVMSLSGQSLRVINNNSLFKFTDVEDKFNLNNIPISLQGNIRQQKK